MATTPLRRRMIEELILHNLSTQTQRNYIHHIAQFALHYNTSPDRLGLDEVRNFSCPHQFRRKRGRIAPAFPTTHPSRSQRRRPVPEAGSASRIFRGAKAF